MSARVRAVRPVEGDPGRARAAVARAVRTPGRPLESAVRRAMEVRFAADFSRVRVHTDPEAAGTAVLLGAAAYTYGHDVVFAPGRYRPATADGLRVIGHELAHVLQQAPSRSTGPVRAVGAPSDAAEREARACAEPAVRGRPDVRTVTPGPGRVVRRLTAEHGQHAERGVVALTADLTSPVSENAVVTCEAEHRGPAGGTVRYEFTLSDRDTGAVVFTSVQAKPVWWARLQGARRHYRITCTIRSEGGTLGTVWLDHDTVARDPAVPQPWIDVQQDTAAVAELISDFRGYVTEAAAATGPDGITALFLASVLRMEIANTPLWPTGVPRVARASELAGVGAALRRREKGEQVEGEDLDRSVGVGQVKSSTAAMVGGAIPWREQNRSNRAPARRETRADYMRLGPAQQRELFTLLAWPRSNIATAARVLARLKNRPHRYPAMRRTEFGASWRAVQIVATEYQIGPSSTKEADAGPSGYGRDVWTFMQDALMKKHFPNV